MAAAEVLKKKIQELMNERDVALDKGDKLEAELNEMKEQLLKVMQQKLLFNLENFRKTNSDRSVDFDF